MTPADSHRAVRWFLIALVIAGWATLAVTVTLTPEQARPPPVHSDTTPVLPAIYPPPSYPIWVDHGDVAPTCASVPKSGTDVFLVRRV